MIAASDIKNMGKASGDLGPLEVSFSDENSCTIRKKVVYLLAFLAIASCVVVGLLVYYVGVMGVQCPSMSSDEVQIPGQLEGPSASTPKKEKVYDRFLKITTSHKC